MAQPMKEVKWNETSALILMIIFVMCIIIVLFGFISALFYLLSTRLWWISVLFFTWMYMDRNISKRGGRRCEFIRRNFILPYLFRDYFDVKLIKMQNLNPEKNYIMGYHPHGSMVGLMCTFLSPAIGFEEMFPHLKPYLCVMGATVQCPLGRDLAMALGAVHCGAESFDSLLNGKKGNAVGLAVGGVVELYDMHPGMMRFTLKRRKGFVKMALKYGASLVPVLGFGDNDVYDQLLPNPPGSLIRRMQMWVYHKTGANFGCQAWGKYGFLPFKTPIHVVVGRPIDVNQVCEPTQEEVDSLHELYIASLSQLFEDYKPKFPKGDGLKLEIV